MTEKQQVATATDGANGGSSHNSQDNLDSARHSAYGQPDNAVVPPILGAGVGTLVGWLGAHQVAHHRVLGEELSRGLRAVKPWDDAPLQEMMGVRVQRDLTLSEPLKDYARAFQKGPIRGWSDRLSAKAEFSEGDWSRLYKMTGLPSENMMIMDSPLAMKAAGIGLGIAAGVGIGLGVNYLHRKHII